MHYIIIPKKTCEERRVFLNHQRTPDGEGVVITVRELGLIQFSPGTVTILNTNDLVRLMSRDDENETPADEAVDGQSVTNNQE